MPANAGRVLLDNPCDNHWHMIERTIRAATHGRYLVAVGSEPGPRPLLVGFHGYAESAETEMNRLQTVNGINHWIVAAVQALHRFYRGRTNEVVASWMTSQDRTRVIADNCAYVAGVIDAVSREWAVDRTLVLSGFSQGVAMAFRAATSIARPVSGVIACGGDVPPELDTPTLARIPTVLIGRGLRDEWYTAEKLASDVQRLQAAGVAVQTATFDAGHDWPPEFSRAVSLFLQREREENHEA